MMAPQRALYCEIHCVQYIFEEQCFANHVLSIHKDFGPSNQRCGCVNICVCMYVCMYIICCTQSFH